MGKFGSGIIGAIFGVAIGAVGGLSLGGGAMMGVGVATGLSAGVCSTVQAAQEEGLLTAEQVDQILNRAAADLTAGTDIPEGEQMVGSAAQCDEVMVKLKSAS